MLVPAPMDDFEELRISGEEVTADGEEIAELELEVEPEQVTGLLWSRWWNLSWYGVTDEQWKSFLKMESTPGEDAVGVVEMTAEVLELLHTFSW